MKTKVFKRIASLAILILATHSVFAQNASLTGIVTDAETKETIIGGNISLEGTTYRAVTDLDGKFTLPSVKAGKYNLIISYMGYQPQTLPVTIQANQTSSLSIELRSESTQMESVTVTARANLANADRKSTRLNSSHVRISYAVF